MREKTLKSPTEPQYCLVIKIGGVDIIYLQEMRELGRGAEAAGDEQQGSPSSHAVVCIICRAQS